ncbi:hypothetical protein ANTPLA_LOCUS8003 [Anthophora plagiata]
MMKTNEAEPLWPEERKQTRSRVDTISTMNNAARTVTLYLNTRGNYHTIELKLDASQCCEQLCRYVRNEARLHVGRNSLAPPPGCTEKQHSQCEAPGNTPRTAKRENDPRLLATELNPQS